MCNCIGYRGKPRRKFRGDKCRRCCIYYKNTKFIDCVRKVLGLDPLYE